MFFHLSVGVKAIKIQERDQGTETQLSLSLAEDGVGVVCACAHVSEEGGPGRNLPSSERGDR